MGRRVSRAALLAAVLGCESMTAPPRVATYSFGISDAELTFHWPPARLPVRYYVVPDAGPIARRVTEGITAWERQLLYGEYRGVLSADSNSADVLVSVTGGAPPDRPLTNAEPVIGSCAGRTTVELLGERNQIVGPLRIEISWDVAADPVDVSNCLARVVTHEIGHTLGLFAHSADPLDLMNTNPRVRDPSTNDRQALQILYHTPADIQAPER